MDQLKEWFAPLLEKLGCRLYDIEWDTSMKTPILRVSVENTKGAMDLDTCAKCSEAISELLDAKDWNDQEYMLEVCSPGAERELKTEEHLNQAKGEYVYCKMKDPKEGLSDVTGDLIDIAQDSITIAYKLKGRPKKITIDKDNIAFISTAVKL